MTACIKPSYDEDRNILADVVPLSSPLALQLTPSSICNFRCSYCIHATVDSGWRLMDYDDFLRVSDQLQEFDQPVKQVTVAGWGEPLVNKRLPAMVARMKDVNKCKVSIVTNGSLLRPSTSDALLDAGVDSIKISLQGMSSLKYFEVSRAKVDFQALISNIRWLYQNKGEREVFVKIADTALCPGDDTIFYDTFGPICDRMYIESICPVFDEGERQEINKFGQQHPPVLVCPHPFYNLNIAAGGEILPCCSFYDPTCWGTVRETTLKRVWDGVKRWKFLLMLLSKSRNRQCKYPVCKGCKLPDMIVIPGDELDERAAEVAERFKESTDGKELADHA